MQNFIRNAERFFLRNRDRGIRNLMLWIAIGTAAVYLIGTMDRSGTVWHVLCFDRTAILHGQVWRLLSWLLLSSSGSGIWGIFLSFLLLFFYYRIGLMLENVMGVCKFNFFYLTGVMLMDLFGLIFDLSFSGDALSLSLFAAFATMYPNAQILLMYILPIRAKILVWIYLGLTALSVVLSRSLIPVVPLANYLLFFAPELKNLLPDRPVRKARPNPNWADSYRAPKPPKPSYRHKCTVCGRTDADDPNLEFRYCSQCNGYYCYCMEHINHHAHIR